MSKRRAIVAILISILILSVSLVKAEKVVLEWTTCCAQQERADAFQELARRYMDKNPNVVIEWSAPGAYGDTMKARFAAGAAPDIAWMGTSILEYVDVALPLDALVAKNKDVASIHPSIMKMSQFDGKQVGLTFGTTSSAFYYNKDEFNQAGLTYPTRDWTFDDVINSAKRMTYSNSDGVVTKYGVGQMLRDWDRQFAYTWGGDFYSPDNRKTLVNNPASVAALQWYGDHWNSTFVPFTGPQNKEHSMFAGNVAMNHMNIIEMQKMKQTATWDWDVEILPAFVHDGKRYNNAQVTIESWIINKNTQHPQEALDFLAYLMSPDAMRYIASVGFVIPSQPKIAYDFYKIDAPPTNVAVFLEGLNWARRDYRTHPIGTQIGAFSQPLLNPVYRGEAPASQMLAEMERGVNALLDEFFASRK